MLHAWLHGVHVGEQVGVLLEPVQDPQHLDCILDDWDRNPLVIEKLPEDFLMFDDTADDEVVPEFINCQALRNGSGCGLCRTERSG